MTPSDGADWTLAKINHNVAHFTVIQAVHFLRQHLIWEAVLTGLIRNLGEVYSPFLPLFEVLVKLKKLLFPLRRIQ